MDYLPSQLNKNIIAEGSNNYILKVNSRDRNILNEPNPFDFKIKFNKVDTKYTTYYEKGYFGSGNKWIDNNGYSNWGETGGYYSKTFVINNGAIIDDQIEKIKDINVTEIVVPRYIPEEKVGLEVPSLEVMACPTKANSVFLRGIDRTNIKYVYDNVSVDGCLYNMVEIKDVYSNLYYLMKESDMSNIPLNLMKSYILFNNFYTDTIELNNKFYKITDISDGHMTLRGKDGTTVMDFLKTTLRLPKYYQDTVWYDERDATISKIYNKLTFNNNSIIFDESGESLITVDFAKDTILEVLGTHNTADATTSFRVNKYYFKIDTVIHKLFITSDVITYSDVTFNSSNNTITLNNLNNFELERLNNLAKNINTITIAGTASNDGTGLQINEAYQYKSNSFIIKRNVTTDENNVSANISFTMTISKKYPHVNLNETEHNEMKSFLSDSTTAITNKISMAGEWIYGGQPTGTWSTLWKKVQINHLKAGIKDLLNEKLFYLSLEPIVPSRNLITNGKLNNVLGVFYPSTQSKDYIFLTGQNRQKFNGRNLQNLKDISFKLYYMNGNIVGKNLKNYSLDYLELDKKQTNITFQIEQVDKFMV